MTHKNTLYYAASLFAACFGFAGCGDDGAQAVDAGVDAPEGPFVEMPIGFDGEDGGEIRIENLIFPDGISRTLTTAFFNSTQAGGRMPFPSVQTDKTMPLTCNKIGDRIYPFGDASETIGAPSTWAPGGRTYMDVGSKITFQAPGKPAFELLRYENFITPFLGGSFHDITYNPAARPDGDTFLAIPADSMGGTGQNLEGTKLTVTIPGGPDLSGERVFGFENGFKGIEIPPRPVVAGFSRLGVPSVVDTDAFNNTGGPGTMPDGIDDTLGISRSTPFTVSYDVPNGAPADLLGFIAVFQVRPTVALTHLCVHTFPTQVTAADRNVTLTVPAATVTTFPPEGIMFVAHLLHRTRTFDNVRRIDMIGTACTATLFSLTP